MSKSRLGLHLEDYLVGPFTPVLPMHYLSCPCLGITTVPLSYVYGSMGWNGSNGLWCYLDGHALNYERSDGKKKEELIVYIYLGIYDCEWFSSSRSLANW
jgi:hypothetical protein